MPVDYVCKSLPGPCYNCLFVSNGTCVKFRDAKAALESGLCKWGGERGKKLGRPKHAGEPGGKEK